jgi:cytochrome c biogenesis factor
MSVDTDTAIPDRRRILGQATGVLLAPIAMLAGMEASFALTPAACESGRTAAIHIVHGITLLLTLVGGAIALHEWRLAGVHEPGDGGSPLTRARFLGLVGVSLAAIFALVVLAQWLPSFFLLPCQ